MTVPAHRVSDCHRANRAAAFDIPPTHCESSLSTSVASVGETVRSATTFSCAGSHLHFVPAGLDSGQRRQTMRDQADMLAFVGVGIWLWILMAVLFAEAIVGLIAFQSQF